MPSRLIRSDTRQALIRKDQRLRRDISTVMRDTGAHLLRLHEAVVREWDNKPKFKVRVVFQDDFQMVEVSPDPSRKKTYLIWLWVNNGTRPHKIRPKRPGYPLRFQTGYNARTAPVAQYNMGDGRSYGAWRSAYEVNHPGTEARLFTETFSQDIAPRFRRSIDNAFRRALRR